MQYVVQTRGFGVVTGEIGSGKSTAVRALFRKLDGSRYRLLYLSDASRNPTTVLPDFVPPTIRLQFPLQANAILIVIPTIYSLLIQKRISVFQVGSPPYHQNRPANFIIQV